MPPCDSVTAIWSPTHHERSSSGGLIDKARIMLAEKKMIGSSRTLMSLSREKSGQGIPQALYLLAMDAAANNKLDDAVFYYNLLREGVSQGGGA